ncbi:MAG: arylesterase [Betaproteobacteria bacterium]
MTTHRLFGVVTLLGLLSFPVPAAAAGAGGNNAGGERIMVYGDSLSAGYGMDPKNGWVTLLQAKLKPEGVTVINSSISGETSVGGVSRIKTDLASVKPTVVVLALGANDGLRGLPVTETRKNLQTIITAIQAAQARVALVAIQIPPNYGIDYAQQFRDLYPDLAKQNKLPPPPFLLEGMAENLDMFQADRMHPKVEAQPAILANVLPTIRKVLGKVAPAKSVTGK